jgi:hypothetical protein
MAYKLYQHAQEPDCAWRYKWQTPGAHLKIPLRSHHL